MAQLVTNYSNEVPRLVTANYSDELKLQDVLRDSLRYNFVSLISSLLNLFAQDVVAVLRFIKRSGRQALLELRKNIFLCKATDKNTPGSWLEDGRF